MKKLFAFVGCSKTKRATKNPFRDMMPAREVYTSDLFTKRVAHIESRGLPWMILSAKSGCKSIREWLLQLASNCQEASGTIRKGRK